jgi:hypothetical protein
MSYTVRTIFLQNYFAPAQEMAVSRRAAVATDSTTNMKTVITAMKRTELAQQTLEKELNGFAQKGFKIVSIIPHPSDSESPYDLLITVILSQEN